MSRDEADEFAADTTESHHDRNDMGYGSAFDYLNDEMARVALLVKAYVIRRSAFKEAGLSPLHRVTESAFSWQNTPFDPASNRSWQDQLDEANQLRQQIFQRLERTPADVSDRFPLTRLRQVLIDDTNSLYPPADSNSPVARSRLITLQLDVLLVALLDSQCSLYRSVFGNIRVDDETQPNVLTIGMAAEICQPRHEPGADNLALFQRDIPLLRDRYVDVGDDGIEPSRRRLQIDPAIARFLLGAAAHDSELQGLVTRYTGRLAWEQLLIDESPLKNLQALSRHIQKTPAVVLLHGPAGGPFVSSVRAVLSTAPDPVLYVADVARAASLPNWAEWTTRVYRLARLDGAAILWQGATAIIEAARTDNRLLSLLRTHSETPLFISADTAWDPDGALGQRISTFARIELPVPCREVRQQIWQEQLRLATIALPSEYVAVTLDLLASFQFTEGQVIDAIMIARGLELTDSAATPDQAGHLYDACRRVSARGLISFTQRIPPRQFGAGQNPLDSVILASEGRQQLEELNDRIQNLNRVYYEYGFGNSLGLGRGLIALFSGPSGTGKTLAATALASCRERDLYKVDMSAVVSKYVGETEKNLARVFSDAQSANALLFFDEADAIFGKRGEIDKAQDRWANMEINYLLQRVEEFSGVVILATNLKQNIDDAFLRRVQVLIDFKVPDAANRQKILTAMFPNDVERPNDADLMAFCEQFELTGGNLKNVAVDAAFRALHDLLAVQPADAPALNVHRPLQVHIEHLVLAAAREFRKLSRPVSPTSFGRRFYDMVRAALLIE